MRPRRNAAPLRTRERRLDVGEVQQINRAAQVNVVTLTFVRLVCGIRTRDAIIELQVIDKVDVAETKGSV